MRYLALTFQVDQLLVSPTFCIAQVVRSRCCLLARAVDVLSRLVHQGQLPILADHLNKLALSSPVDTLSPVQVHRFVFDSTTDLNELFLKCFLEDTDALAE